MKTYYDNIYFTWQKKAGEYGANQDSVFYQPFIKNTDVVLDFGCGGGYLLQKLICKEKYGVDINPKARREAKIRGIKVFSKLDSIPPKLKFDVIISHHALEHVENPAQVLISLRKLLRKKSNIICIVPIDDWRQQTRFTENDINKHLYTWTPLILGNLFIHCGFKLKESRVLSHAWLPLSRLYYRFIPKRIYYALTAIWSNVVGYRLIRVVAGLR